METPKKLLKPYNPKETEERIYKLWEESGFFNPDKLPGEQKEVFSMIMPPPNVTGSLHMGHAAMLTIEDIMVRFARMQGKKTLWIPGTDHAAIATEVKVEKLIYKAEGKTRHDLGREEFLRRGEEYARKSHDTIVSQIRRMGASCDWSREAYTLDEPRSRAVRTAFEKMHKEGLIYRGDRIVNWDPRLQTTVSDDEIEWKEEKTNLYYLKYGPFTIATARPETKFGDKYVVMHPNDSRYKNYKHGQKIELEWINGPITATVIKDNSIDMEFGTGVMTITPWHDLADFEISEHHKLDKEQIINLSGKLLPIAGEFADLHWQKARPLIVKKLKTKDLIEKIEENYLHRVATNSRGGELLEPQIMKQWFVKVAPFKKRMRKVVESGEIKIIPERFQKIYFHWIDNLRDWCISRQIWYGHKIPIEGDPDTLDTWFSSGLWTFSTLGWPAFAETATAGKPGPENDLANFHPTTVLETGYDILFFWVARMILMSTYLLNEIPFRTVYLHGLVRDEGGKKMSKSLGNIVDPVEMIEKYGADAVRMALIIGTSPGNDSRISEDKIRGYKHFANKLWNIARFVVTNSEPIIKKPRGKEIDEFDTLVSEVTKEMDGYKFYLAAEKLYHYVWHIFADKIIEESKGKTEYGPVLRYLLENSLKLLHPFMPFITEEIWSLVHNPEQKPEKMLIIEKWPTQAL